ncbi:nuclear pore complex protein Nup153 isoform X2 [Leguminivora glycinivorella]|uniref:nuclear pore complex protein Nup153 isoform X2 n=1 Tax=Leguminivora glycinivorella TaxID=1035111 RepID=UPI00200F4E38|nr:nuclear pore complex protein Nup153 isoform X2 [Leguminivora glycinivorella]
MSSVFSKNKGKRSRTSSGESNNSFVKNVTSRVSGLLPATITKWFSSPRSSANGSAGGADATDSSTEDEGTESPVQPPNKRMRREERSFESADASCVTNNIETIESSTQYTVQSPPGRTTFRRETNFVSTPIRMDDTTATVDRTTVDRTTVDRTTVDRTTDRTDKDSTVTFTQNTTAASIGLSASRKRKSLFRDKTQELSDATQKAYAKTSSNTLRDPRQPTFKPTLLGSPFYAGKTTYGGAASSYINQPNISQRQNTTVKEAPSTSDNNMSTSARRILELLESYSSPLMDAKRIPHYTRPTRQEVLKRHSESSSLSLLSPYNKTNSYKTQELHVPSIASILRLKQRSRLNDSTNAARQLVASHSSSSPDYLPYPSTSKNVRDLSEVDGNSKFTTKVKTKRTRIHGNEANALETETITPVELPKAVLQIDPNNLPNFSIPVSSKPSSLGKHTLTTPFAISTSTPKTTAADKSAPKESEKKTEKAAADWNCPDCWVKNKSDAAACVCCGHKHQAAAAPAAPAKCSLCKLANSQPDSDKCVNCAKVQVNNIAKPLKADTAAKWSCKDCWASNDDASAKCACCGAANPKKQATQTVPVVEKSGGMCSKCFSTKNSDGTCRKCAESKPDNSFKIVLKSQANKWECEHCLVRNDSDKTKCVCCEAERAGAPKQPEKKQFNFGTVNTTFKFGIDPKVQEANLAKISEKPVETDKVEESETNNNVLAKAPPTFSFGIPAKKSEDQPDTPKAEKTAETPKATFTFGIPKQNSLPPTSTPAPMFGFSNKQTEASKEPEKKDKPEETQKPVVNDKPEEAKQANEPAKPPVMMFGAAPLADKSTANQLLSTAFTVKKDAPSASLSLATTSTPAPILTFSAPTTRLGEKTGLFGVAATSAPATTISFAPTTTATATSALSMFQKTDEKSLNTIFQKSEPSTTAPTSLFPKSDSSAASVAASAATAATAPAPAPAAAPMFSFGSSQAQSAEKPSFNFTFGSSNKSDVFKPPTFAAKDSTKFSLGGSSTENPLAPNPLAGGNGLSATNNLASNALGGNGLSVNPLAVGLSPGNGLSAPAPSIFGSAIPKENSWTPPNNSAANPFNANATTNSAPKPFSFGSSTPFSGTPAPAFGTNNTQTSTPAFGSNLATSPPAFGAAAQPAAAPAFGASQTAATPAFGSNVQSTPNIFGMPSQNSQPSIFSTPNQNSTGMFGSPSQPAQPPSLGMFGRPNVGATPTFGTPNPSIPTFEAPSVPAPAPSFNFGTPQSSSFMFGQQPQQQAQQPQTGVYNFGAAGGQTQVQFSMGSAPAGVRRVRRGVRRSSQR